MLRITSLAAFCILGLSSATAQVTGSIPAATPTLKRAVIVTSNIVRIGDLVDQAGALAGTPIFRSPDLGETGAVAAYRVADAVRPYGLVLDTQNITEVTVERAGRVIPVKDIAVAITRAL